MKKTKDYTVLTLLICLLLAIAGSMVSCVPSNMAYKKSGWGCPAQHTRESTPSYRN